MINDLLTGDDHDPGPDTIPSPHFHNINDTSVPKGYDNSNNKNNNKNNLVTAHSNIFTPPLPNTTDSTSSFPYIDASPHNSRFSILQSSPPMKETNNTIPITSLNVRGLNNQQKFNDIIGELTDNNNAIIGLQETKLREPRGNIMFKHFANLYKCDYKAYWSFDSTDQAGGVGLIIAPYISKYVQRIHRYHSRFIAIDLFLPGRKLTVINIYNHQQDNYKTSGKELFAYVKRFISNARKDNFKIIILGDFNLDPHNYYHIINKGLSLPAHFALI